MRILFVTDSLGPWQTGLPVQSAHALARMAQREGHQVLVVVAMRAAGALPSAACAAAPEVVPGLEADAPLHLLDGVPLLRWDLDGPGTVDDPLAHWLPMARFDVAHAVVTPPMLMCLGWLPSAERPLLLGLAGLPSEPVDAASQRLLRQVDLCLAPSDHAAARWRLALPDLAVRTLAHGVDLLGLLQAHAIGMAETRTPTLVCIADPLDHRSGVQALLQALLRVDRPELRLRVLCTGPSMPSRAPALAAMAAADPRVRLEPAQGPGLLSLAGAVDAVCVPSRVPLDFSLPVHDAAVLGLPCLVSDLGAQAESARRYGVGRPLPAGDVAAWAAAIEAWATVQGDRAAEPFQGDVPLRIEEQAFLCQGHFQELLYRKQRV
ncbi:glycosyltransferase [Ideonella sp. A 288]|uniref:glycosyltransferase n=1 Tax=Ideonella sp. A 288 TaxID=1962181 RepID=UPI000B4BDDE3|nr:glycosyltransferase [Ideonella sp. A 288]